MLVRVMPSVWSWYHIVVARWSFWYVNTALPAGQLTPLRAAASARNRLWNVPTFAKPLGMLAAAGRYHASG